MRHDKSISMTKGLAIMLMVLVHARFSQYGDTYINMFHMPLFFFMSGYCFKETYLGNIRGYIWKRVKGAYWPFVKWGLLFLLLHNIFFSLNIYNGEYGFRGGVSKQYTTDDFLQHTIAIVTSMSGSEQLLGGYWFLHSYFVAAILSFGVFWISQGRVKPALIGGGIILVLSVLSCRYHVGISRYLNATDILATFFMVMGYVYKKINIKFEEHYEIMIPLSAIIVAIGTKFWPCAMLKLEWWKIIPYSFSSLAGTMMVFSICKCLLIKKIEIHVDALSYIGDKTLEILTWHLLCFKVSSLVIIEVYNLSITRLAEFPVIEEYAYNGWWILYFIIGISLPLAIALVLSHTKMIINNIFYTTI